MKTVYLNAMDAGEVKLSKRVHEGRFDECVV